jgi:SAM-dependent methyltransferase
MDEFRNVYHDQERADSYAALEFPGTYYLAFRDIPEILSDAFGSFPPGSRRALDFGCGAGRSTRFVKSLGFAAIGVDISASMVEQARARDPEGEYFVVEDGTIGDFGAESFDLVFSAFTFDNIPASDKKLALFQRFREVLRPRGKFLNLVSSPLIYVNEWASFSTKDFPENRLAKSGDHVRIVMLDVKDRRPVEDVVCSEEEYRRLYEEARFAVERVHRPLGNENEPFAWVSEAHVPPWVIWVVV